MVKEGQPNVTKIRKIGSKPHNNTTRNKEMYILDNVAGRNSRLTGYIFGLLVSFMYLLLTNVFELI